MEQISIKSLSKDTFNLRSQFSPDEIRMKLTDRTLLSDSLTMVSSTDKDFIGKVNEKGFSVIDSLFPIGVACVVKGEIESDSRIRLTSDLHRAFRVLFGIWVIGYTLFIVVLGLFKVTLVEFFGLCLQLVILGILFRLFLHGVYILARNRAINNLARILELKRP